MSDLCKTGMLDCAFEVVFGAGMAVILLILICAMLGFFDRK